MRSLLAALWGDIFWIARYLVYSEDIGMCPSLKRLYCKLFLCLLPVLNFAQNVETTDLIGLHIKAMGGEYALARLEAFRVEGTHLQNGQESQFKLHKKRPDLLRFSLTNKSLNGLFVYNGKEGWARKQVQDAPVIVQEIKGPALSALMEEARFESPLMTQNRDGDDQIRREADVELNGSLHYVLTWAHDGVLKARYFLDATTYLVSKRELIGKNGETELTTYYANYLEVAGYLFAYKVTNEVDGQVLNTQSIEEVRINPGILSFYFEKPLSAVSE